MHVAPSEGKSRDVAGKVIDMLFPPGAPLIVTDSSIGFDEGAAAKLLATHPVNS